jgi:hypothetical protein
MVVLWLGLALAMDPQSTSAKALNIKKANKKSGRHSGFFNAFLTYALA